MALGILGVLVIAVVASLISPKGRAQNAVSNARRHAAQYIDTNFETDPQLRDQIYERLQSEEQTLRAALRRSTAPASARRRS